MMKYYRCKISLRVMCSRVFASLEVRGGSPTFPPLKKSFTPTSQGKHLTSSPPPPPTLKSSTKHILNTEISGGPQTKQDRYDLLHVRRYYETEYIQTFLSKFLTGIFLPSSLTCQND
jgi:hypothetical protein